MLNFSSNMESIHDACVQSSRMKRIPEFIPLQHIEFLSVSTAEKEHFSVRRLTCPSLMQRTDTLFVFHLHAFRRYIYGGCLRALYRIHWISHVISIFPISARTTYCHCTNLIVCLVCSSSTVQFEKELQKRESFGFFYIFSLDVRASDQLQFLEPFFGHSIVAKYF